MSPKSPPKLDRRVGMNEIVRVQPNLRAVSENLCYRYYFRTICTLVLYYYFMLHSILALLIILTVKSAREQNNQVAAVILCYMTEPLFIYLHFFLHLSLELCLVWWRNKRQHIKK